MARRKKRTFTKEFKADAVKLVREGGRSIPDVARSLDLTETSLREWVARAPRDPGAGVAAALTASEREELHRLRRENKRLEMEKQILKKAAAFFAKEHE